MLKKLFIGDAVSRPLSSYWSKQGKGQLTLKPLEISMQIQNGSLSSPRLEQTTTSDVCTCNVQFTKHELMSCSFDVSSYRCGNEVPTRLQAPQENARTLLKTRLGSSDPHTFPHHLQSIPNLLRSFKHHNVRVSHPHVFWLVFEILADSLRCRGKLDRVFIEVQVQKLEILDTRRSS